MKRLTTFEQFEYYVHTLNNLGLFLRECDTNEIEYCVFEEFDSDCVSFLHENTLNALLRAGLITSEIFELSLELAQRFRRLENTPYWNARSVQTEDAWAELLALADKIKAMLNVEQRISAEDSKP